MGQTYSQYSGMNSGVQYGTQCSLCQGTSQFVPRFCCKSCNRVLCMRCSGLSEREMHVFSLPAPKLIYLCDGCHQDFRQVVELRKLVDDLQQQVQELRANK